MKSLMKLAALLMIVIIGLGSAGVALADEGHPPPQPPRRDPVVRGEVTAISDTTLTVAAGEDRTVTVQVSDETQVRILGQGEGSLADVQVGSFIGAHGPRQEETVEARLIVILPDDPRNLSGRGGQVTAIEGSIIQVKNRQDQEQAITTTDQTRFRVNGEEASLADVEVEQLVQAVGREEEDGSFVALAVMATSRENLRRHFLVGKVIAVDTDQATLTVEARGNKQGTWTIHTTPETKYRVPNVENPTLADVPPDAPVIIAGQPAEDGSQSGTARLVAVAPPRARAAGEVTAIEGSTFTLESLQGETLTILTDDTTRYRTRDGQELSFEDVEVGGKVLVLGQPVEEQERTIQAKVVGLKPGD